MMIIIIITIIKIVTLYIYIYIPIHIEPSSLGPRPLHDPSHAIRRCQGFGGLALGQMDGEHIAFFLQPMGRIHSGTTPEFWANLPGNMRDSSDYPQCMVV